MLRLPVFEFLQPKDLSEALELKGRYGEDSMFISGGTDLYPNMKRRQFEPRVLIGLKGIQEMQQFEMKQGLLIGAGVSLERISNDSFIVEHFSAF